MSSLSGVGVEGMCAYVPYDIYVSMVARSNESRMQLSHGTKERKSEWWLRARRVSGPKEDGPCRRG